MSRSNSTPGKTEKNKTASYSDQKYWINASLPAGFILDRPYGARNRNLFFLHFRSPITLITDSEEIMVKAGGCIFFAPATSQKFTVGEDGLVYDGIQLTQKWIADIKRYGLALNEVFYPDTTVFIPAIISAVKSEADKKNRFWQDAVNSYISMILVFLAQQTSVEGAGRPKDMDEHTIEACRSICIGIMNDPAHDWSVEEMAEAANMSRSRFSVLFKSFSGQSPKNFLINTRLKHSLVLLTNTPLNISQIAEQSGFKTAFYFSRIFSKRIGCSPSDYNKRFLFGE